MKKIKTLTINPQKNIEIFIAEKDGELVVVKQPIGTISQEEYKVFQKEAEILQKLQDCPYIIKVKEAPKGLPIIVYEYAPKTLKQIIPELTIEKALGIAEQILDALEYIHTKGIVHGDLNPNNVLIGEDGKIRIIDFDSAARRILYGIKTYTPKYTAPEQLYNEYGDIDERTDIFQFGCILYEMIEKKSAFTEEWWEEIKQGKHQPYEKTPEALREIIDTCLAPRKEERWPSTKIIKRMLKLIRKTPIIEIPEELPPLEKVKKFLEKIEEKPTAISIEKIAEKLNLTKQQVEAALKVITKEKGVAIIEDKVVTIKGIIHVARKTGKPIAEILAGQRLPTEWWQKLFKEIEKMNVIVPIGKPTATKAAEKSEEIQANVEIIADYAVPKKIQEYIINYAKGREPTQELIKNIATATNTPIKVVNLIILRQNLTVFDYKHGKSVESVAFSPDGKYLATGSLDKYLRVFETRNWSKVFDYKHGDSVRSVAFSPDGKYLATGSYDNYLRVFEILCEYIIA